MSKFFRVAAIATALVGSGCAIHPLPEDITGVPTYTIVRQIRCETRQTIIDTTLWWLTQSGKADPASAAIGQQFVDKTRRIQTLDPKLFKGRVRGILALFFETGVAYHFQLEITEINNLGTQINLLKPFTTSTFTMGIGASADRSRENTRIFAVTDRFSGLLQLPDDYCDGSAVGLNYNHVVPENPIYPITGKIGVERLVRDFIELTLFANLAGPPNKEGQPPTLVDGLEFETTISGTLTPKIVFAPAGNALRVTDASVTSHVKRKDLHKITMGLAVAGPGVKLVGPVRSSIFTQLPLLTTFPGSSAEQRAAEAVNQALTLKLFRPTIVVTP